MPNKPFPTPLSNKLDQPKKRDYWLYLAVGWLAFTLIIYYLIQRS